MDFPPCQAALEHQFRSIYIMYSVLFTEIHKSLFFSWAANDDLCKKGTLSTLKINFRVTLPLSLSHDTPWRRTSPKVIKRKTRQGYDLLSNPTHRIFFLTFTLFTLLLFAIELGLYAKYLPDVHVYNDLSICDSGWEWLAFGIVCSFPVFVLLAYLVLIFLQFIQSC